MKPPTTPLSGGDQDLYPVPHSGAQPPSTEVRGYLPQFEEAVDLHDYLDILFRRKWIILTVLVCVFITTLIVSFTMKPVYKAEGRLDFNMQSPKVTKFQDVVESQLQAREFIQTQVQLLRSRSLAQRVIQKLHLEKVLLGPVGEDGDPGAAKQAFQGFMGKIKGWLQAGSKTSEDSSDEGKLSEVLREKKTEKMFFKCLGISPQRDTTIVNVDFNFTDPALARNVVNTFFQEFIGWMMDTKIDSASTAKEQLEKQIQLARVQLEKSEGKLNEFAQKAGIVSLEPTLNLVYKQLEETNKALAESSTRRMAKEAIYKQTLEGDTGSLPQVVDSKLIQDLRKSYIDQLGEFEEQSETFMDNYPKVKRLKAKLQDTQNKITAEEARIAASIKNDYLAVLKEEEELRRAAKEKQAQALNLNSRATQYKIFEREVETSKQIHQSLLERFKEIDATVGTDMTNIHVVDYADLPVIPFKPNIPMNLALAVAAGLLAGVGLAFFLDYMDKTVKRLDEISEHFQIALLGVLPLVPSEEARQLDYIVNQQPKASFTEAIRTIKVSIELSSPNGSSPRKILLTSTSAGEGKSTTTCNLAQAYAASDERVVILDCDLRKPRLHKVFNTNGRGNAKGLSHFLSGVCESDEIVRTTEIENLKFISAGPIPPNPAELLASPRMYNLLERLSQEFDRIIIDGPPASGFADVLVLGGHVDGVILVSALGQTHREALRIFVRSVNNVQGTLLGCVVNKFNMGHRYGYYKYYKYYHYNYKPYGENADNLPSKE